MKLKQLSCPRLHLYFEDAFIIYEVNNAGCASFELVVVRRNNGSTSQGQNTGQKVATSVNKFPLENMLMNVQRKAQNELKIRDIFSDSPFHYYKMTFHEYNEAQDVYNKYAGRISLGCSPRPRDAE